MSQDRTIICVDDNFVNLNSIRLQLETMGFLGDIRCFQSAQLALDFVFNNFLFQTEHKKTLDLIITDSNMAMMSGLVMVKKINKLIDSYILTQKTLFAG